MQSYECNSCHDFEFNCAIVQYEYNRLFKTINYDFGIIYSVFVFFCDTYVVRHVGGRGGGGVQFVVYIRKRGSAG